MTTSQALPEATEQFLLNLYEYLYARDIVRVRRLYEQDFPKISEQYYSYSLWPSFEVAAAFLEKHGKSHQLILILYRELWYRHAFSRLPEHHVWQHRIGSWNNYSLLFEFFATSQCSDDPEGLPLCVPSQWLWDMFDEFCYQFQEAHKAKWDLLESVHSGHSPQRTPEEIESLTKLWNAWGVMQLLSKFIAVSGIEKTLEQTGMAAFEDQNLFIKAQIGYFSAIAVLKLKVACGEYAEGLEQIEPIIKHGIWQDMPGSCKVTLYYSLCLAHFMCQDYAQAAKYGSQLYVQALKGRSHLYPPNNLKKHTDRTIDKTALLVLISDHLSLDAKIDEYVLSKVRDHLKSEYSRLNSGAEGVIGELFRRCLPRMTTATVWDASMDAEEVVKHNEAAIVGRQVALVESEYVRQKRLEQVLSFAKLYNNVTFHKLAVLSGSITAETPESEVAEKINDVRQDIKSLAPLAKSLNLTLEVDGDTVHVVPHKAKEIYTDQFLKQASRIAELIQLAERLDPAKIRA